MNMPLKRYAVAVADCGHQDAEIILEIIKATNAREAIMLHIQIDDEDFLDCYLIADVIDKALNYDTLIAVKEISS